MAVLQVEHQSIQSAGKSTFCIGSLDGCERSLLIEALEHVMHLKRVGLERELIKQGQLSTPQRQANCGQT